MKSRRRLRHVRQRRARRHASRHAAVFPNLSLENRGLIETPVYFGFHVGDHGQTIAFVGSAFLHQGPQLFQLPPRGVSFLDKPIFFAVGGSAINFSSVIRTGRASPFAPVTRTARAPSSVRTARTPPFVGIGRTTPMPVLGTPLPAEIMTAGTPRPFAVAIACVGTSGATAITVFGTARSPRRLSFPLAIERIVRILWRKIIT